VVTGSVDANAAYLSAGVIDDGENALTMGSTACWGMAHTADKFIPGLICMPHIAYSKTQAFSFALFYGREMSYIWDPEARGVIWIILST